MPQKTPTFSMPESLVRRIGLAAASLGESSSEYVRNAVLVALDYHVQVDPALALHFEYLASRERQASGVGKVAA